MPRLVRLRRFDNANQGRRTTRIEFALPKPASPHSQNRKTEQTCLGTNPPEHLNLFVLRQNLRQV